MVAPIVRPADHSSPGAYYSVQRIGAGLINLGNTCFLNSVLQCLTYTPPLAEFLQKGLHKSSCRVGGFCAMCALENHVKQALSASGRAISPAYLVKHLRCISRSFQMLRQEDAHEYMRYLIEGLHKCCPVKSVRSSSGESFIQKIFGGQLRSQVKCTVCSHCSNTYDPFLDLSLEIVRADTLQAALAHFTATEVLDGENKYHCGKCKSKVRALKRFTVDKAPHVLTIQLKRFSSLGRFGGKIDKKLHFNTTLDIKPFVSGGEGEELKYSLYAILVHAGWSTHSGHYYCFVRTTKGVWHMLDDSRVSQVSERTVLDQKAYMLFYLRDASKQSGGNAKFSPTFQVNGNFKAQQTSTGPSTPHANCHAHEAGISKMQVFHNLEALKSSSGSPDVFDTKLSKAHIKSCEPLGLVSSVSQHDPERVPSLGLSTYTPAGKGRLLNGGVGHKSGHDSGLLVPTTRVSETSLVLAAPSVTSEVAEPCSNVLKELGGGESEAQIVPDLRHMDSGHALNNRIEASKKGKRKKFRNANSHGLHHSNKRNKVQDEVREPSLAGSCESSYSLEAASRKSWKPITHIKKVKRRRAMVHMMFIKRHFFKLHRRIGHI